MAAVWLLLSAVAAPLAVSAHNAPPAQPQAWSECAGLLQRAPAPRNWQLLRTQLQAQGLQLQLQGCPHVRLAPRRMQQVLDVRVLVVQADVAADWVRGPLADGEEVDMGAAPAASAQGMPAEDLSPDVQFNRQWLAQWMQRHGFAPVAGHWWAFVPTPVERKR